MARPKVFFDMTIGGKPAGRIVFEVSTLSVSCMSIYMFAHREYDSCTARARSLR